LTAAFLAVQLEHADEITHDRLATWEFYHHAFAELERRSNQIVRPVVPTSVRHNGHLYYLLLRHDENRDAVIRRLRAGGISAPFHYVPLHSAPAGVQFGRTSGSLAVTDDVAARLIRLPLWYGMGNLADRVVEAVSREVLR
jgi:dTDP-4-amino-4,6-dideoxygalactose transaminase